jgi:phage gp36-like protein
MAIDYLTRQEIGYYLRDQELPLNENDEIKEEKINLSIDLVRREMEVFLREGGYKVPLLLQEEVNQLKHLSLPIFKYYVNSDSGSRTEQIIKDYDYARSQLKRIANNTMSVDIPKNIADDDVLQSVTLQIW